VLSLLAFGAAGLLDAAGSAALVVHFRHAVKHDELADHHERRAALVIGVGMVVVGGLTASESIRRLVVGAEAESSALGVVVAGLSIVALSWLAVGKLRLSRRVDSDALEADGLLSAAGAALAAAAIVGATLGTREATAWVDAAAALGIGLAAATYGLVTTVPVWRAGRLRSADRAEPT
jgi:divalent metal cation (Fe/Co/Zn/Cd) transporter